ncbi:4'-phosphopantetheinyl transferase family protein [Streptomyces sp. H34-S4]|uniref:4'-phosphopantetheinyl transferase family protein n=1 Tax=Streptomyces sp. H34-S4 TaxID=2996463 RepID=UPI002271242A|nr:4'-phosphopantetheinyl transferase superfamily protein [Streptomyces sp. H34-S4]MCY0935094.1 4'-phosphopantetheinyl transferase superfamily protein [Streptomyces sp. H34-S4]
MTTAGPPGPPGPAGFAGPAGLAGGGTGPPPVKLWFCPNDTLVPAVAATLATHWLDEHEQETVGRFLFERDRRQYLVAHALVRRVLALETGIPEATAVIRRSARGRPFLQTPVGGLPRGGPELDFNLSHAHAYNLLGVVREGRIGVDVERLDRGERWLEAIVESFAPDERDWMYRAAPGRPRDLRALRLWTLKEAYAKARGLGLGLAYDSFGFTPAEDRGVLRFRPPTDDTAARWRFLELQPVPGVVAAVAVEGDGPQTPAVHLHHGFPWGRPAPHHLVMPAWGTGQEYTAPAP